MSVVKLLAYIAVMMIVTYLVRMLPLVLFRKPIESKFVKSFLYYIPYAVLGAMTFPTILYVTGDMTTAICGLVVGIILSFMNCGLFTVSMGSCAAVLIAQYVIPLL